MHSHFWRLRAILAILCGAAIVSGGGLIAAEKTARDLLPPTIVGYLEVPQPGKTLATVLDHPLANQIQQQPEYQKALHRPEYQQLQAAVKLVEEKLGMPWRQAAGALTSGGLYVGFDLPTQGIAALAQTADEKLAEKARDSVLDLARSIAAGGGKPDPVQVDELRGVRVHQIRDVHLAVLGKWLLVSNKRLLVAMILENYLSDGQSLGSDKQFQSVLANRTGQPSAWLYVDLRVLRLTGILRSISSRKSDNPPVELLAGGILGALPDASYVTAALDVDASHLKLTAALPCNPRAIAKTREFYFGAEGSGTAPPLLRPAGTLLSLATYRDLASLWRHAPDLFDERINAQMAEAESRLTTFFAGRNFRDEILGNLEPGVQLVVARQEFPQGGVTPAIKLPAAAVVMRMKKPEETARLFKITFQSLMGFLNVVGGMNKVDPLDLNSEKVAGALVISGEYLPPPEPAARTEAKLHFNASPTIAFVGDRFILATARPLALELIEHVQRELPATQGVNTIIDADGKLAQAALADNRGPLIAQNMLDKGHERSAAETEIDGLLRLLQNVQRSSIQLTADDSRLQLAVEVELAGSK